MDEITQAVQSENKPGLSKPWDLLKRSVSQYKENFKFLSLIALIPTLAATLALFLLMMLLAPLMVQSFSSPMIFPIVAILMFALSTLAYGWAGASLVLGVSNKENSNIKETLKKGFRFILPYWILSILSSLAIMGGFLLLIVPGIILAIWFSLSPFTLLIENKRGVSALQQSREYLRNLFWPVAGRIAFLAIAFILFAILLSIITMPFGDSVGSFLTNVLSILAAPIAMLYWYQVYQELKSRKAPGEAQGKSLYIWIFVILGVLALILSFILLPSALEDIQRENFSIQDSEEIESIEEEFEALFDEALQREPGTSEVEL